MKLIQNQYYGYESERPSILDPGASFFSIDTGNIYHYLEDGTPINSEDMNAAVYDPTGVIGDAFSMDNMVEGTSTKILTATERSEIAANTAHITSDGSDHTFIDQDVTSGAAPVLDVTNMTNLPTGNATHTGEVTGATALTIADNVVDEANLKLDEAPTNDYVLTADSTKSGGMKWAAAAGGGEVVFHSWTGWIDAPVANNTWISRVNVGDVYEYDGSTGTAMTSSATTISNITHLVTNPLGIAVGAQTVESFRLYVGAAYPDQVDGVSLLKVTVTDSDIPTISSATVLYENNSISIPTDGTLVIPAGSFTETSISDKDLIMMFFGANTVNDVHSVSAVLKCTID